MISTGNSIWCSTVGLLFWPDSLKFYQVAEDLAEPVDTATMDYHAKKAEPYGQAQT
jgi:hypothetical protein